jgi:predicted KAP-like P-loop ATPase
VISKLAPSQFSADRPIRSKSEDLLGRTTFAESLAEVVEGWTGNDSLVMALYGPWGIGKSSIKNMVLEHLRGKGSIAPTVVEFTPWQWAAQDQLAQAFFREIALALGKKDEAKLAKRRADQFSAYAAYLKLGKHLMSGVRPLLATVLALAGGLGIAGSIQRAVWLKPIVAAGGIIALALAGLTAWSTDFAEKAAEVFSSRQKLSEKDLRETKAEVSELLRQLRSPILIVIDDVDRLTAEEVRLMFQLIKANADFPNLVYLALFQRDIVEESLQKVTSGPGKDFLEKIVQVGFDVPQVEKSKLQRVLFARLDEALADPTLSKNFKPQRWANLFVPGLAPYFETLRDVYRFLGVLDVQLSRMSPRGSFEVNPIDLIALEVLRVFDPDVYHLLPKSKELLTKQNDARVRLTDMEKQDSLRLAALIAAAQPGTKSAAKEILEHLFPKVTQGNEELFYRELRVCHPNVFDRYFLLSIPEGDVSQADLDALLASTNDRNQLVTQFKELKERGLLAVVLDRLEAYKQEVTLANAVPFITALFDIGDDLPEGQAGMFSVSTWMHASRIIRWYLMKEPDLSKRHAYLSEAIRLSKGLYLPAMKVALETDSQKEGRSSNERLLSDEAVEDLKAIVLEKIRNAADSARLSSHSHLATLLVIWAEWAGPQEAQAWVEKLIQSSDGLIFFLEGMTVKATEHGSGGVREFWYVQLSAVERFIDPEILASRLDSLKPKGQNESQIRALKAFSSAIRRRREGKPEGRPWLDWTPEN